MEKQRLEEEAALAKEDPKYSSIIFDRTHENKVLNKCFGRQYHAEFFAENSTQRI